MQYQAEIQQQYQQPNTVTDNTVLLQIHALDSPRYQHAATTDRIEISSRMNPDCDCGLPYIHFSLRKHIPYPAAIA